MSSARPYITIVLGALEHGDRCRATGGSTVQLPHVVQIPEIYLTGMKLGPSTLVAACRLVCRPDSCAVDCTSGLLTSNVDAFATIGKRCPLCYRATAIGTSQIWSRFFVGTTNTGTLFVREGRGSIQAAHDDLSATRSTLRAVRWRSNDVLQALCVVSRREDFRHSSSHIMHIAGRRS